jgi:hypothetical protein
VRQSKHEKDDVTAPPEVTPGRRRATVTIPGRTGSIGSVMAIDLLHEERVNAQVIKSVSDPGVEEGGLSPSLRQ